MRRGGGKWGSKREESRLIYDVRFDNNVFNFTLGALRFLSLSPPHYISRQTHVCLTSRDMSRFPLPPFNGTNLRVFPTAAFKISFPHFIPCPKENSSILITFIFGSLEQMNRDERKREEDESRKLGRVEID